MYGIVYCPRAVCISEVNYSSVCGCEGWMEGEGPMGMWADEPHLHRLYPTNSPGDGWVGYKSGI